MATLGGFTVVGAFKDRSQAEQALVELGSAGFHDDQFGIAIRDDTPPEATPGEGKKGNKLEDIAAAGAAAGGTLGALAGAVATGLIPGIGTVIAAGLMIGILGGTALGAAAGGCIGALVGLGVEEEDARFYDREFLAGRTIVAIQATGRLSESADILRRCGAYSVSVAKEKTPAATTGAAKV